MPALETELLIFCLFGVLATLLLAVVAKRRFGLPPPPPSVSARSDASGLPPPLRQQLIGKLQAGRKIEAIKELREAQDWGLKRAKEAVEALQADL